jgi:hypothetical protein
LASDRQRGQRAIRPFQALEAVTSTARRRWSATRQTSTYFGGNSTNLGATGGLESNTLTTTTMPAHTHGVTDPTHFHNLPAAVPNAAGSSPSGGGSTSKIVD